MLRRTDNTPPSVYWALTGILLSGLLFRTIYVTQDRFHADEALYAGWALRALDEDPFLLESPVDKPPLYLYTLAASMQVFGRSEFAARLPNLAASTLGIVLFYCMVKRLYDRRTALWAAWFFALSPFDILFARTAFTDSLFVMWILAALYAISLDLWSWAGLTTGLAFATKQHAVILIPLVIAVGYARTPGRRRVGRMLLTLARYLFGFLVPFALVNWWDSLRWNIRPGYWQQSALSYGGLSWSPPYEWGDRFVEWFGWARYLAGSPLLYLLVLLGGAILLIRGWQRREADPRTWLDTVLLGYGVAYLLCHVILQFGIWDRYLLPLAPLVSLVLARIVVQIKARSATSWRGTQVYRASVYAICLLALLAGGKAAVNGYPVGGEHWAYQGLDRVVAYLKREAAPDAVLYHHWLRWHYTFYLYDTDFELRWWQSAEHLLQEVSRTPEREQYIVLPDWRTLDPEIEGIALDPVYETQRRDRSVSFRVYRIHPSHR
jgi:4-amino-4-deoxy-L-arabinose transferase-like glycosyltransferase